MDPRGLLVLAVYVALSSFALFGPVLVMFERLVEREAAW